MENMLGHGLGKRFAWVLAVVSMGLAFPPTVLAPPGPKDPAPGPKAKDAPPAGQAVKPIPRPGPKGGKHAGPKPPIHRGKPLGHGSKHRRYVRRERYWYAREVAKLPARTWSFIGYPYYVGGTDYVVTPPILDEPSAADESITVIVPPGDSGETDSNAIDTYAEIQELVALVYEWRMLNESPTLHGRLPTEDALAESHATVAEIRKENQVFDGMTRAAMRKLARGESAESELDSAREHLEKLMELAESLPPAEGEQGGGAADPS